MIRRLLLLSLITGAAVACNDGTAPPVPKQLRIFAADSSLTAGGTTQVTAQVIDDRGNVMNGRTITFTSSMESVGTVSTAGLFTSAGPAGQTVITATSGNFSDSLEIVVAAGPAVEMEQLTATYDTARISTVVTPSPTVRVIDAYGNGIAGVVVTFAVTSGGGSVAEANITTDANGKAYVIWTVGPKMRNNTLSVSAAGLPTKGFTVFGDSPFRVEVIYDPSITADEKNKVQAAVDKWRRLVHSDLGRADFGATGGSCNGHIIEGYTSIKGLRLYVDVSYDDTAGWLARATWCYAYDESRLPGVGFLEINTYYSDYMNSYGIFTDVVLHEIGHVIGFGTSWYQSALLAGADTDDPYFTGASAIQAFSNGFGSTYTGPKVPVENVGGGGTRNAHWRESVFDDELMTGYAEYTSMPVSKTTLGSLADLGHTVDMSESDNYRNGSTIVRQNIVRRRLPTPVFFGNDVPRNVPQGTIRTVREPNLKR
jgi:hypothetical protein